MLRLRILPLKATPPLCQKAPNYRRLDRNIPVLWAGNAGLPHKARGRQGAAVPAVGCGWPCAYTVLVFHLEPLIAAPCDHFTCCPEFTSSHSQDPFFRGRNTISNSTWSILSCHVLPSRQPSSPPSFPSLLPLRTCSSHLPSSPLKWKGKTGHVVNEVKRGYERRADKRK